jgi:hypothetical protein
MVALLENRHESSYVGSLNAALGESDEGGKFGGGEVGAAQCFRERGVKMVFGGAVDARALGVWGLGTEIALVFVAIMRRADGLCPLCRVPFGAAKSIGEQFSHGATVER